MAVILCELHRQDGAANTKYVLQVETHQHQMQRQPTVLTVPGDQGTGKPNVVGYDLGIVAETFTLNGLLDNVDRAVGSGDPAYEEGVTKVYPGAVSLRTAALYWWLDGDWATKEHFVKLRTPLLDVEGIIASLQLTQDPAQDYFHFSLQFRVAKY